MFSSSHLLIFTSVHLHIFSPSHPHIFTSSHLHILTSSHLVIFTSAHLLLFTSSHLYILSCPLALSFLSISLLRRGAVTTRRHETQPFRTKRCSIAKNCRKIMKNCDFTGPTQPFRTKWRSIAKNWGKIAILNGSGRNPFARNEVRSPNTEVKLRFSFALVRAQFRTKWCSIAKNWSKIAICKRSGEPFGTKRGSNAKNCSKIAISRVRSQPFRTKWCSIAENWGKIAILNGSGRNPFARNEVRSPNTEVKLRFWFALVRAQPFRTKWCSIAKNWGLINCDFEASGATLSLLCVKGSACKSFCV